MSLATKYWIWGTDGSYYGMPLLNLFGWFVTGVALMVVFEAMRVDRWIGALSAPWLIAYYGANLLLPVGMAIAAGLGGAVAATAVALGAAWLIARAGRSARGVEVRGMNPGCSRSTVGNRSTRDSRVAPMRDYALPEVIRPLTARDLPGLDGCPIPRPTSRRTRVRFASPPR
jgi:hypothetical protein